MPAEVCPLPKTTFNQDPPLQSSASPTIPVFMADPPSVRHELWKSATEKWNLHQASPIIGVKIDPFKCTGAVMTGLYITYIGMGTAFVVQTLTNASPHIDVTQALTSFTSAGDAQKFVDRQFQDWQGCDGTDVTGTSEGRYGGPPQHARLSKTDNSQGVNVNVLSPLPGAEGRQCQHVMSARNNVVVDVRVCAPDVGDMGLKLDQVIGENITGRR